MLQAWSVRRLRMCIAPSRALSPVRVRGPSMGVGAIKDLGKVLLKYLVQLYLSLPHRPTSTAHSHNVSRVTHSTRSEPPRVRFLETRGLSQNASDNSRAVPVLEAALVIHSQVDSPYAVMTHRTILPTASRRMEVANPHPSRRRTCASETESRQ